MNTKIYSMLIGAAACLCMSACHDDNWTDGTTAINEGSLDLASMALDVDADEAVISRADVNTDAFIVTLIDRPTQAVRRTYTFSAMPEVISLPVGDYTVNIKSHEVKDAEWAAPYYEGSADFSIEAGKITEIGSILCKFSSIKVTIRYTQELTNYMGDDARVRVIANDRGILDYTKGETRAGYFRAAEGSSTLVAEFSATIDGNLVQAVKTFTDVAAGQHHIITFSVKNGNAQIPDEYGTIDQSGIKVDAAIDHENVGSSTEGSEVNVPGTTTRPGEEQWPDDPTPGPGPDEPGPDDPVTEDVITIEPNAASKDAIDFDKINSVQEGAPYKVDINAKNLIANLKVDIQSSNQDFLDAVGDLMPTSFDLANLEADLYENLASIGLKGDIKGTEPGENVRDQSYVLFDITDLVPLLGAFNGEHKFVITVTDKAGNTSTKTLTFNV